MNDTVILDIIQQLMRTANSREHTILLIIFMVLLLVVKFIVDRLLQQRDVPRAQQPTIRENLTN